jgi:MFS transporter, DHA1 family, multidrug resistance protein
MAQARREAEGPGDAPTRPADRRLVWAARAAALVAFLDLFAQFPVVAPYARDLGAGPATVGAVVAAYSVAGLLGNLGAALLMDRWGRTLPLVLALAGSAAALALYGAARGPAELLALRAVHGLAAGVLTPGAFAMLGDAVPPERRARAMGSGGALVALAAIVAPPLAGIARDRLGAAAVFLAVAGALGLLAVLVAALVREPVRPRRPRAEGPDGAEAPLRRRALLVASGAAFAFTVGLGALVAHLPLVLDARGLGARASGAAFAAYAVVALLAMAGPAPRLADRHGRHLPLAAGLAVVGAALAGLAMSASAADADMAGVYASMGLVGLGFGLLFPAATALVADAGPPSRRGAAFGVFYAVYSLGVILGSLASGLLAETLGASSPAPFAVGAACALLAAPAVLAARPDRRRADAR